MRTRFPDCVEEGRDLKLSAPGDRFGFFLITRYPMRRPFKVMVSDGADWEAIGLRPPAFEHVSVSLPDRCPTWEEMCWIKDLFFSPEEVAIQYHPRASEYVNNHPFCLHIWKPIGQEIPTPPPATVGVKAAGRLI